ncbi:hypothetical protein K435DRAFT_506005 [Dendrothele bispora CBS 962.96]|uniref:Uncharacterized protein n=1 Tax=Dendrothele bispora (strain CBS 962.96) TaxID=1314807 RepID=A0A4S8MTJ3_DENBC|nr:hypothetical protein K435DRAFT_506005 [Dendrothele bispora CBS 962.96]
MQGSLQNTGRRRDADLRYPKISTQRWLDILYRISQGPITYHTSHHTYVHESDKSGESTPARYQSHCIPSINQHRLRPRCVHRSAHDGAVQWLIASAILVRSRLRCNKKRACYRMKEEVGQRREKELKRGTEIKRNKEKAAKIDEKIRRKVNHLHLRQIYDCN